MMQDPTATTVRSALRKALLLGAALCLTPAIAAVEKEAETAKPAASKKSTKKKTTTSKKAEEQKPGPLADFGKEEASPEVVHIANWVSYTRNNQKKAFVVVDKKQARMYLFEP